MRGRRGALGLRPRLRLGAIGSVDPGPALPDPVLWLLAAYGVTGTGPQVDSWATRSSSGVVLLESGSGKPTVVGDAVEMGNTATTGDNYFVGGTTSTFRAITETGVFSLAWRGRIDDYDAPQFTIDSSLLHTRGSSGAGCNLFIYAGGSSLAMVTWNSSGTATHQCIWDGFGAAYTLGDHFDIEVIGDGAQMRMYFDGVQVGTTGTIVTSPGAHAVTPHFGRLTNAPNYYVGGIEGILYDDSDAYTVEELRGYVAAA